MIFRGILNWKRAVVHLNKFDLTAFGKMPSLCVIIKINQWTKSALLSTLLMPADFELTAVEPEN